MFRKKKERYESKPDPPDLVTYCLITLVIVVTLGFSFSISALNAINANFRYAETKSNATIPELPISTYPVNP